MGLAIRIGTGLVALGMAGSVAACSSSTTPSGVVSSASAAVSSASSFASSAASNASSVASSVANSVTGSGTASGGGLSGNISLSNISGGSTKIMFDQTYMTALQALNLNPTATGQAQLSGNTATLPVTGGSFMLSGSGASGQITHSGGIQLGSGSTQITLTNFVVDPAANKIYADITAGGQQVASHVGLFDVNASSAQTQSSGSNSATISGLKLTLSTDAASALNKALNTTAIQGNFPVGTATITLQGSGSGSSMSMTPSSS